MTVKELQVNRSTGTLENKGGWEHLGQRTSEGDKIHSKRVNERFLIIKRGVFIDTVGKHYQLKIGDIKNFERYYAKHDLKYVYCIEERIFIGMNWRQNQRFLFMQKSHWIQQESNLRYIVNIIFLIIGAYIGIIGIQQIPS